MGGGKSLFFLSGIPRSGSTVLASILSARPDLTVTPTSPFLDLLYSVDEAFGKLAQSYTFDRETVAGNVFRAVSAHFHDHIQTPYVVDKHRGHPRNVVPLKRFVTSHPKILCTVRPIPEVIASYIALMEKNPGSPNFVDAELLQSGQAVNTESRSALLWEKYISDPYNSLMHGIRHHRENLHLVPYDALVSDPAGVLEGIYDFLGIPRWEGHRFDAISATGPAEKDFAWGLEGLHQVRPVLEKTSRSARDVLGHQLASRYEQFNIDANA